MVKSKKPPKTDKRRRANRKAPLEPQEEGYDFSEHMSDEAKKLAKQFAKETRQERNRAVAAKKRKVRNDKITAEGGVPPEKGQVYDPNKVYFIPYENKINDAFGQLIKHGYVELKTGDIKSGDAVSNDSLPVILQTSDVVTKQFNQSPMSEFSKKHQIMLHYPDMYNNFKEATIMFGLFGFKQALKSYGDKCGRQ